MLAKIANRGAVVQKASRRRGQNDLPSVGGGGDSRSPVDVDPDVAFVRQLRLPGVDPDPDANRAAREPVARVRGGCNRVGCSGERNEERVALRVDLDACVRAERRS